MTNEEIRQQLGTRCASVGITVGVLADALEQQAEPGVLTDEQKAELTEGCDLLRAAMAQLTQLAVALKFPAKA